jgi:hypothetical protein
MKRLITFVVVLAFTVNAGPACKAQEQAYVGLFADSGHSVISVNGPGTFLPFTMWIWWRPSVRGMVAGEIALEYPSNVIKSTVTTNSLMNCGLCCLGLDDAVYACFFNCQVEWVWSHQRTCYLTDGAPTAIRIVPSIYGNLCAASCELGNPVEPATVLSHLYLNQSGAYATEPTSWGTIKSLYR